MDKKQREIIENQRRNIEIMKMKYEAELKGRISSSIYSNINHAVDYCREKCKDDICFNNCVYKNDSSLKIALNVIFANIVHY
jgi:hypothetical protein